MFQNTKHFLLSTIAFAAVAVCTALPATAQEKDIVDTAVGAGKFTKLVGAVKAAGLVETLKSEGPFTVFAPSDDAFAKIPEETLNSLLQPENAEKLKSILTYHVVSGAVMAADAMKLTSAKTVEGSELTIKVDGETVMIDSAKVVAADIKCSNGVIHIIDSVIMPKPKADSATQASKDVVDTAVSAGSFNTLVAAVKAAGLVETLKGKGPFTVLAPTDDAFKKLPEGTVETLLKPENKDQLVKILTYHVIPASAKAADVSKMTSAPTVQGGMLTIKATDDGVMVNKAKVVKTDIECTNGIIHVIDSVILPE
jgi:uncharacterized surface protein with fasciclin (FAS1) repeats